MLCPAGLEGGQGVISGTWDPGLKAGVAMPLFGSALAGGFTGRSGVRTAGRGPGPWVGFALARGVWAMVGFEWTQSSGTRDPGLKARVAKFRCDAGLEGGHGVGVALAARDLGRADWACSNSRTAGMRMRWRARVWRRTRPL